MNVPLKLSSAQLNTIASRGKVAVPNYNRSALKAGIVHFGVGNFHRAHQARYLDELFTKGSNLDWAIIGAGVMPADVEMRELLAKQDFLYTLVEQHNDGRKARVIGSIVDFLPIGQPAAIVMQLSDPQIHIVSLTITEGGYFIDATTGTFDVSHPQIRADAANQECPKTVFGMIAAGLKHRRANGVPPFTVLSCDNVPHNGRATRNAVLGIAAHWDAELAEWIGQNVAFPNSMVDRITPATGDRERQMCKELFEIDDQRPVFCEDFKQWVLEDNFCCGRPALEQVGVQFVPNAEPYERMKLQIINGGHAVVAYASGLLDIHFVHDAVKHPLVAAFLHKVILEEVVPLVPSAPDMDSTAYFEQLEQRLANPNVGDTVRRLCLDGSNRQPKFIVPSIADALNKGSEFRGLALASALWCRYCFGVTETGQSIEPNDPNWEQLQQQARNAKQNPLAWLGMESVYGSVVAKSKAFQMEFAKQLQGIWKNGVEWALKEYLK